MKKHTTFDGPRSLRQIAKITAVLARVKQEKMPPMPCKDIAEELFITVEAARLYLVHLVGLKENRTVRICAWQLSGTRYMALYALGSSRNVARPKAKTKAQRHQAMMADPVALAKENATRRNRRRKQRGLAPLVPPPAAWFAPLGAAA